ncbi:hypothetical protein AMJ49_03530 [Parcubacteria bacterium DG_74_2]|nr:MAG: hypothetical protein AMJ49_03530 [Parcubacteria bacterium DG_74_2]
MGQIVAEWLKEWMEKNKRHRTINAARTLVCPKQMFTIDVFEVVRFHYCPLCGTKLGSISTEENHYYSWQH